jgi:MFS family permease
MTGGGFRALPRTIWILGFTSLFMDASSELVHSLLPLFLVAGLGASVATVGLIDGIAEATASITKIFSGALSDWLGHRKWLAVFGYGLSAVTKPLFPLAGGAAAVLVARFFDRLGKGIRGAPRDALVADVTPPLMRGAAYGLRQGLDTVGAVIGPLLAAALMGLFVDDFRLVFWVACLPAVVAVAILAAGVEEPKAAPAERRPFPLRAGELARLGRHFWIFIGVVTVLLLPRFSEAFMLLRGQALGLAETHVPLIMALMNLVAAGLSAPAGRLSDSVGRRGLVLIGFAALVLAQGALAAATTPLLVFLGASLWGVHLGVTQGVLSALVADLAPADLRGTAFGVFNLMSGLAILVGSSAAGWLWDTAGAGTVFALAAAVSLFGLLAFLALPADRIRRADAG